MAAMATPEPNAPALEHKSASPEVSKEQKTELNGHKPTSPKTEGDKVAPKLNGSGTKSESNGTNGVADTKDDSASHKSEDAPVSKPDEEASRANTKSASPALKAEEEAPVADTKKNEDVDMSDAKPAEPTPASPLEKHSSDAALPTTDSKESETTESKPAEPEETPADSGDVMAVDERRETPATEQDVPTQGPEGMSQLNITDDTLTQSPAADQVDVAMGDAPASAKLSRERDDDSGDEPLAKRARTEPQEEVQVSTSVADGVKNSKGLQGIENWNNTSLEARTLTPYQMREIRRIIAGVKKTKNGMHFKDSVIKMWPTLSAAYMAKVDDPTDLGELERGLRDQVFTTLGDFKQRLSLIYKNTLTFNGEYHDITHAGLNVVETVWTKSLSVPEEEPPRPKATSKAMPSRHHEQRTTTQQQTSAAEAPAPTPPPAVERPPSKPKHSQANRRASSTATSPTDGAEQTFALPPGGVPQIRRASTNADGDRPKRAIHPPKSKDIDYSNKSSVTKKHLKPEIQFCDEVLREIMDEKHYHLNAAFLVPVDPVALGIPTYFNVIKKPMDLSTISAKLNAGEYSHPKQFQQDMDLMFNNCFKFNTAGTPVHMQGKQLKSLFQSEMSKKDQWLAKHASSKPGSTASDGQSDDESEAEVEVVAGGDAAVLAATIATLQEKLQEETTKLNQLYMEDLPNEALIKLQSTVLSTVQQSLLAEKQKYAAMKSDKPIKAKPTKTAKPKGGAGGRKSTGAAAPKKPASTAKKPTKKERSWGAAERNQIATALSDPSFSSIEQAISIIKKDTGQAENNAGVLELDIDQLSTTAIQKLWDLCSKAVPGFGRDSVPMADAGGSSPQMDNATGSRPPKAKKKNKPMNAREQEERISKLKGIRDQFRTGGTGGQAGSPKAANDSITALTPTAMDDSSDSSDSEEE
ncbi:hypothetical protein jhhlp_002656 [Lomentospora prolificans]|uniref:Bromo domain-containing protein n=1 Tax=Lomentospora prolificans TaxID=41688 RepID=A0A2N3NEP1_9PEZI|nr:hypothetical protein jhhlp_002656 [Lomentospora prolificans]